MTVTFPPIRRPRGLPRGAPLVFAAFVMGWFVYVGAGLITPKSEDFPLTPRMTMHATVGAERSVTGQVTLTAENDASRLGDSIEISVYPYGIEQTDNARIRKLLVGLSTRRLDRGSSVTVPFTWDGTDDAGRPVPAASYAIVARATAEADRGSAHTAAVSLSQVTIAIP